MPWKNKLGETKEISRFPLDSDEFLWRVSIASVVSDGPFSNFPGVERCIVVLPSTEFSGKGLRLSTQRPNQEVKTHTIKELQPFVYSGESTTRAELIDFPVADFNVMTRRGVARAETSILSTTPNGATKLADTRIYGSSLEDPGLVRFPDVSLFYCVDGMTTISAGGKAHDISKGDAMMFKHRQSPGSTMLNISGKPASLCIRVDIHELSMYNLDFSTMQATG